MHTIDIYRGSDLYVTVKPDDSSTQNKQIMGSNEVRLQFELNFYADFMINDYATVFSEKYILFHPPIVTKKGQFSYEYSMTLKAEGYGLTRAQFLFLGSDNTLRESEFSLMGTAEDFLDLVLANANRVSAGWTKGQVIIAGYKNMTFSTENCYNALGRIAEEFGTEFFLEGKVVHITKRQKNRSYTFRHGKDRGLYEIKRTAFDDKNIITRLYAYGSEQNLPTNYRRPTVQEIIDGGISNPPLRVRSKKLLMPQGKYFLEQNIAKYGIIEATQLFEDIFPRRTGIVSSVNATDVYEFSDASMDFDVNTQLLPGLKAKVTFNTGQLAGFSFDIEKYTHTTKTFRIIKNKDEQAVDVPGDELKPAIGDNYVLVDIDMPVSYIVAAEAALQVAAEKLLQSNSEPLLTYQVILDPVYIDKNNIILNIGDLVYMMDAELNISRQIRVTVTNRGIVNESDLQIELSDVVDSSPFSAVVSGIEANVRSIDQIGRQLQNTFNGKQVGDLSIEQGTLIAKDLPVTSSATGFSDILIENATGKLYRKI